jgi:hypothetical protein
VNVGVGKRRGRAFEQRVEQNVRFKRTSFVARGNKSSKASVSRRECVGTLFKIPLWLVGYYPLCQGTANEDQSSEVGDGTHGARAGSYGVRSASLRFENFHGRKSALRYCVGDHGSSRSGTSGTEMDGSNKPNVKMSVAEAMLIYCLPSTI